MRAVGAGIATRARRSAAAVAVKGSACLFRQGMVAHLARCPV